MGARRCAHYLGCLGNLSPVPDLVFNSFFSHQVLEARIRSKEIPKQLPLVTAKSIRNTLFDKLENGLNYNKAAELLGPTTTATTTNTTTTD